MLRSYKFRIQIVNCKILQTIYVQTQSSKSPSYSSGNFLVIITLTGSYQSGKTTLVRETFSKNIGCYGEKVKEFFLLIRALESANVSVSSSSRSREAEALERLCPTNHCH